MSTTVYFGFPGGGHVIPSLPLVAELVRRGERVHYFVTPEFKAAVERAGATFHGYGGGFPLAQPRTLARFRRRVSDAIHVQLEASRWVLDHFARELATSGIAYVMHDSLASWGWYMTQTLRVPSVALFPTFVYDDTIGERQQLASVAARVRRSAQGLYQIRSRALADQLSARYGAATVRPLVRLMQSRGNLNLVFTSREFHPNGAAFDGAHFKFIGPSVSTRADAGAFPVGKLDSRPLILISLGTTFNNKPQFYELCFRAFAHSPWQIVMVVGENTKLSRSQSALPNFIVRTSVPQLELLQRAVLFISHGGMNSVNEALYYNVPLLLLPQGADHAWVATRTAELGAGIRLSAAVDAGQLRRAAEEVLARPAYAESAARIGASLRATGGIQKALEDIMLFKDKHAV